MGTKKAAEQKRVQVNYRCTRSHYKDLKRKAAARRQRVGAYLRGLVDKDRP